jgi:hypothetical protein
MTDGRRDTISNAKAAPLGGRVVSAQKKMKRVVHVSAGWRFVPGKFATARLGVVVSQKKGKCR